MIGIVSGKGNRWIPFEIYPARAIGPVLLFERERITLLKGRLYD